jgi:hypothetical protein
MKAALKAWVPIAVVATFLAGTVYAVGHQILRQSANDPQIQQAEDWAGMIEGGTDVNRLSLGPFIDPARSLAPFGIVYNQDGNIVASSVSAPSTMKQPDGVFDRVDAAANHEVRFTWQPASGDRYAAVIKRASFQNASYYVLAGRNLKLIEQRQNHIMWITAAGWLASVVMLLVMQNLHLVGHLARARKK